MPDIPDGGDSGRGDAREAPDTVGSDRYRTFIEMCPDASLAHQNGVVVYCNAAAEELFCMTPGKALLGAKIDTLVHPDEQKALRKQRAEVLSSRRWSNVARRFVRLDGTDFYSEGAARTIELADATAYLVIFRDISERLVAEAAVRDSELMYRTIMENAADAIMICDGDGRFVEVNESALRALGYSREEFVGLSVSDVDITVSGDDYQSYRRKMELGDVVVVQGIHRRKDGEEFPVEVRGRRVEIRGESLFLCIARDTSEQKRHEQAVLQAKDDRFDDFTRSAVDRFWETDAEHRLTYSSQPPEEYAAETDRRLGIDEIGAYLWEKGGLDPEDENWRDIRKQFSDHGTPLDFSWTREMPGEQLVHLRSWAIPVFENDGKFKGYRGTTRDVTEEVESRRQTEDLEYTFLNAMETITEGFSLWDSEHRFVACNGHFLNARPDLAEILVPGVHFRDVLIQQVALGHFPEATGKADAWVDDVTRRHWTVSEPYEICRDDKCYRIRNQRTVDGGVLSFQLDITEIKHREEALRKSETLFRTAFENSAIGLGLVDVDGHLTYVNSYLRELLGYEDEELLGKSFADVSHPDDLERSNKIVASLTGPEPTTVSMEKRYLRKDGGVIWAITGVSPIMDENQRASGAVVQIQDISERREAEQQLIDSENTQRAILNATSDVAWLIDRDGMILTMNAAAGLRIGVSLAEAIGTSVYSYFPKEGAKNRREQVRKVLRSEEPVRDIAHLDGRWMDATLHPIFDANGHLAQIAVFGRDITEQREIEESLRDSEETFRAFLDATMDVATLIDCDGTVVALNGAAAERFGTSVAEAIGTNSYSHFPPDELKLRKSRVDRVIRTGKAERHVAKLTGRWVDAQLHPVFDADGRVSRVAIFSRDVTEQTLAEIALAESEERFRTAFETSSVCMCITDAKLGGKIRVVNQAFCDFLGYTKREMERLTVFDFTHPDDIDLTQVSATKIRRGSKPSLHSTGFVKRYLHKDGRVLWGRASLSLIKSAEGETEELLGLVQDITQQVEMEEALKSSEEKFRLAFESSLVGIGLSSADSKSQLRVVNQAYCDFLGYTKEELLRMSVTEITHPEDLAETFKYRENVLAGKTDADGMTKRYIHKSGKVLWGRTSLSLIKNEAGEALDFVGIIQNITDQKEAEQALLDSEDRLRSVISNSPVGIAVGSAETSFRMVNQAYCDFLGYTEEEFLKLTLGEITYPEDLSFNIEIRDKIMNGELLRHDWDKRFLHKDGRILWARMSLSALLDSEGKPQEVIAVVQDITEQKLAQEALMTSEERFRGIFEKTAVGMGLEAWAGDAGNYNRAFGEFIGYPSEEIEGMRVTELMHPDEISQALEDSRGLWEGEVDQIDRDTRFVHHDGRLLWARVSRSLIRDGQGKPKEVVGIFQDITDHKLAEESLRQAQKMEAVGQLTGGVAHDFNNLLAAILGNLELIGRRAAEDPEILRRVERAIGSAKAGGMLTNRLLAFSRRQTLEPKVIEASSLVDSMTELLQTTLGAGIGIEMDFAEDAGHMMVDQNQLENALLNLAINARDAMGTGGSFSIRCRNEYVDGVSVLTDDDLIPGDYVTISVTDTGQGMDAEILEHCFEPFFTTKDVGEGSGLGLSMVYGFMKQSGGRIDVTSAPGKGTTFKLYLPKAHPEMDNELSAFDGATIPTGNGERIFIVEDDEDVRDSTSSMLRLLGYEIIDGGDGQDAMERLERSGGADIFLTDIVLQNGLRGTDLASEVTRGWPDLPIVYMTGYAEEATAQHGGWPEVEPKLLQKPFNMRELADKVRVSLDRKILN